MRTAPSLFSTPENNRIQVFCRHNESAVLTGFEGLEQAGFARRRRVVGVSPESALIWRQLSCPSALKLLDLISNGREAEELPHPQGRVVLLHALVPQGRVQPGCRGVIHIHMQMHALVSGHVNRAQSQTKIKKGERNKTLTLRRGRFATTIIVDGRAFEIEMSPAQGGFAANEKRCV